MNEFRSFEVTKGQTISKANYGVLNSPKKLTQDLLTFMLLDILPVENGSFCDLFLKNNDSDFCTLLYATHILDPSFYEVLDPPKYHFDLIS